MELYILYHTLTTVHRCAPLKGLLVKHFYIQASRLNSMTSIQINLVHAADSFLRSYQFLSFFAHAIGEKPRQPFHCTNQSSILRPPVNNPTSATPQCKTIPHSNSIIALIQRTPFAVFTPSNNFQTCGRTEIGT
jgi:hypothetical protein